MLSLMFVMFATRVLLLSLGVSEVFVLTTWLKGESGSSFLSAFLSLSDLEISSPRAFPSIVLNVLMLCLIEAA